MTKPRPAAFPEDAMRDAPKDYSLTLAKGMAILEMFCPEVQRVSFQSAATHLGTSRATARRLILTLQAMGYLEKTGTGDYALTAKSLGISRAFLSGNSILSMLAEQVRQLAAEIDCPCSIVSLSGPEVMFLCRAPSRRVYASQLALGDRLPAHASAGGKLLLATKTDDDLRAWCARHAPQPLASRTITEPEAMLEDAARTRARGYATTDGELEDGLVSLGLPVRDHQGAIRLALVVSQFANRMSGKAFVGKFLAPTRAAAERISATYADYLRHNA